VTPTAEFRVPIAEASSLGSGRWFWDLAGWPGIKRADLNGMFGTLTVEGTKRAIARVAAFCRRRGYARLED